MKFLKTRNHKTFDEWTRYWDEVDTSGGSTLPDPIPMTDVKNRATWMLLCKAMELCHDEFDWLDYETDAVLKRELVRQTKRIKGFFGYHD